MIGDVNKASLKGVQELVFDGHYYHNFDDS